MTSLRRFTPLIAVLVLFACGGKKEESASSSTQAPAAMQNPVDAATAANITGSIKFTGTAPKAKKIAMNADAYCLTQHSDAVMDESVVVNPNNTLQNVYIYVKSGLPADLKFPTPSQPAVLDQHGCLYRPHVLGVQTNQEIVVRNSDGVLHNVNARPKNNPGFNFGQPVKGMENKKSFANPEVMIPLKCDVHPWMHSYIGVQNHPYFAVTGADGAFALSNLPPGTYEIEAWQEKLGTQTQKVTVGPKETKSISFTFKGS